MDWKYTLFLVLLDILNIPLLMVFSYLPIGGFIHFAFHVDWFDKRVIEAVFIVSVLRQFSLRGWA